MFFLPNNLCVHVRKLGTSVRKSTTKTDLQILPNQFRSEQTSFSFQKKTGTRANLRSFLSSQTGVHLWSIDCDLAYEVEMLVYDSVGYELRGKLGVPLRFLSRTAQPPKQSSPKEAMALNASHAINFFLPKTSVKATKLERRRSNESRQLWRGRRRCGQMANVFAGQHQTCVLPARNVI